MKKLLPILLGLSFLALPLGWFLPDEKMIAYCLCGGALLVMLCCIIYALFSKEQFSRLAENMLVVAVLIIAIVLLPLILAMILSAYLVLLSYLIIDNAKAIYRFFIPWIIGISFLALPMSFILSTSMVVTIAIWAIALVAIIVSGSHSKKEEALGRVSWYSNHIQFINRLDFGSATLSCYVEIEEELQLLSIR